MRTFVALMGCSLLAGLAHAESITINLNQRGTPISPLVYGMNFATTEQLQLLNCPLNRSGGNATTRYNWLQNATSSASDWYFFSHEESGGVAQGAAADQWIQGNQISTVPGGTDSMITVPLLGWAAKLAANRNPLWSFSVALYGAQQAVEPWHADAGNGVRPNGSIVTGNNPNDANIPVNVEFERPWLQHITSVFGTAANGGVKYYLLDNEPSLWQETHRDVMPTGVHLDTLSSRQIEAANMVKSVDPGALVCGPEEWGWLGYLHSGFDLQWLGQHNWAGPAPDRAAHSNTDAAPYYLNQLRLASITAGKRLLDVFSLHYYPQTTGAFNMEDTTTTGQQWRNRSTRSLWDTNYTDESWIGQKIYLIPRMKAWINANYPGTKLGITEYNFGAEAHINGAIAQADVLGLLGRHGVDLATRWVCPATSSVTFKAVQMYRNYNGQNGTFGDLSLPVTVPDPDTLSVFPSIDKKSGAVKIMLVHKRLTGSASINLTMTGLERASPAQLYRLTSSNNIARLSDIPVPGTTLSVTVPAASITLIVIPRNKLGTK